MDRDRDDLALEALCNTSRALIAVRSEASSRALAELVGRRYRALAPPQRLGYLRFLATELSADPTAVKSSILTWEADPTEDNLWAISCAIESPRQALFKAIGNAVDGTQSVVDLRGEVLAQLREHSELIPVEHDLHHVLTSWFSPGLIELHRIDWGSPARVLEKIITYEAVHEIVGWEDLRRRLEPDRRCYAFFHPAMPYEPLIFVEVALTEGMVATIGEVLHAPSLGDGPPGPFDTATFYSITSCQAGLSGIPLGDFLIKRVAENLARDLPELNHFVTLSPIPGFRAWLEQALRHRHSLPAADVAELNLLEAPDWSDRPEAVDRVRPVLERLCAHYLVRAKRGREAADAVARFHLRNGARVLRINWMADPSARGLRQSVGLMVSYEYDEQQVSANHEAYVLDSQVVHSAEIARLLDT